MTERLEENARLVEEVKTFGKTLGIEPTEALSRTAEEQPALSMLWLWMQRVDLGAACAHRYSHGHRLCRR